MGPAPSTDELVWGSLFGPRSVRTSTPDTEGLRGLDVEIKVELSARSSTGPGLHLLCILRPVEGRELRSVPRASSAGDT